MSRFTSLKRLAVAALAAAGVIAACRAAQPGEAPPLAPRPEIGPSNPVPGAPDLLDPPEPGTPGPNTPRQDAAPVTPTNPGPISQVDPPIYRSADGTVLPETPLQAPIDAGPGGGRDAGPRPDAERRDAAAPDAPADAAAPDAPAPEPRDAGVPDARDGGVGFPPVPDASFPPDAVRPM